MSMLKTDMTFTLPLANFKTPVTGPIGTIWVVMVVGDAHSLYIRASLHRGVIEPCVNTCFRRAAFYRGGHGPRLWCRSWQWRC